MTISVREREGMRAALVTMGASAIALPCEACVDAHGSMAPTGPAAGHAEPYPAAEGRKAPDVGAAYSTPDVTE